ncbi:dienelactone hydrolase family protein [Sphingomonas immobilis]|uniref:Dienelactone hydrolase family protein n=1 Tax=Sphingomonas immobilis TaxID=3063997 RepID=A0ABT8ZUY7_9SPHN|nr:dienelactone hydrolase family protein [Sphingomonas sp. CA1-15]MDO7841022.1 dienelactone hydrolase family protein [Sphingomonas sp. CA1-15]
MRGAAALALLALAACDPQPHTVTVDLPAGAVGDAMKNTLSEALESKSHLPLTIKAQRPVTLTAADGVKVFATDYRADRPRAVILLFHQAGSGKGEYADIGPRLAKMGYDALAIDQRSGGDLYGPNATVKALGTREPQPESAAYLSAEPDLQAAVDWAKRQKLPIIVWGSSYSSSLAFPLAARNPEVKAVLAFSPGEYFDDKALVETAATKLTVPVFVTSASDAREVAEAAKIAHAVPGGRATQFIPKAGVHGSSTLNASKNPKGAEDSWSAVTGFLRRVAP